jgi:pimeloyl-ACP methyl ester carboxylesterase
MPDQWRFPKEAWIPLLAGLYWLWRAPEHGVAGFLFSVVPGCLLLSSGVAMLLWPGDRRICQFAALGGVLGILFALPAFFVMGLGQGLLLVAVSVAGFVAAGLHSVRFEPDIDGAPPAERGLALAAQVGVDEALLATMMVSMPFPRRNDYERIEREAAEARDLFEARGWLEKPEDYHRTPPPLEAPHLRPARARRLAYEHLSFESDYEPHPEEPGHDRWLGYVPNRVAHAWLVRHRDDRPRPWLICIHGYQMGHPWVDLAAFPPPWLHQRLGLNLVLPVLPLHGRRRIGRRSGDGFLMGDLLDTVHAEAQAMWDLRRLVGWVRSQGASRVGVMGYSLGGYNTALLASLEPGLDCAIAGIPATDFTRLFFRHGPVPTLRHAEERGMRADRMAETFRVISPLALKPRLPRERRYVFGAVADRLVPADQVRDLWRHWEEPAIQWYQGGHITFRAHPSVVRFISTAARESLLAE